MIVESVVLLGIENFEKRRRGVAPEIGAHLVHFVQAEDRIAGFCLSHVLDDLSRKSANIGAPVAPDLGLVPHAAQRKPHEIAARGPGNRLGDGGLSHARRTHQAEDRSA